MHRLLHELHGYLHLLLLYNNLPVRNKISPKFKFHYQNTALEKSVTFCSLIYAPVSSNTDGKKKMSHLLQRLINMRGNSSSSITYHTKLILQSTVQGIYKFSIIRFWKLNKLVPSKLLTTESIYFSTRALPSAPVTCLHVSCEYSLTPSAT